MLIDGQKLLYQELALALHAYAYAKKTSNSELERRWFLHIRRLNDQFLASGIRMDIDGSTPECLKFEVDHEHMDSKGFHDGWTDHVVRVRPSLVFDFVLSISGQNRNDIKDAIAELFDSALRKLVPLESARLDA